MVSCTASARGPSSVFVPISKRSSIMATVRSAIRSTSCVSRSAADDASVLIIFQWHLHFPFFEDKKSAQPERTGHMPGSPDLQLIAVGLRRDRTRTRRPCAACHQDENVADHRGAVTDNLAATDLKRLDHRDRRVGRPNSPRGHAATSCHAHCWSTATRIPAPRCRPRARCGHWRRASATPVWGST